MDIKSKVKSLIKEADLYRSQGLLAESKGIFEDVLNIIRSRLSPQDGENFLSAISTKIEALEKEIIRVEKKVLSPDMSKESQDLITKMFTAEEGEDQNKSALEGAKALIKFGQFDRAKDELQKLLQIDVLRTEAAKQILNCFFLEFKYDDALGQYEEWRRDPQFSKQQINTLENFITNTFKTKDIDKKLPEKESTKDAFVFVAG
jgi:tetratricopeptide (TPR) repeat protein